MNKIALRAEGLSKQYKIGDLQTGYQTFREAVTNFVKRPSFRFRNGSAGKGAMPRIWALKDVSFEVRQAEIIGVIGRNGAGKSTLLKLLSKITEPTTGYADMYGRVGSLLEVGTGFHPELTGRENTFLNGAILGMSRDEIRRQFDAIVAFAEVEKFIDTPVKHYSSGMYLRMAFAIAAHLQPEILLVDEVLAVGDLAFQKKCLGKMGEVANQGRTVLFVSHNMGAIRSLCEKGLVLDQGMAVEFGPISKAIETYYKLSAGTNQEDDGSEYGEGQTGFGPIRLTSHQASTIEQQDPFEVTSRLHIGFENAGFTLLCLMEDMQQRPVFHLRIDSTDLEAGVTRMGVHEIRLKLPALWLEPGLYSIYFKVLFSGQIARSRFVSDILHLDVGGVSCGWNAVLAPRPEWQIRPVSTFTAAFQ